MLSAKMDQLLAALGADLTKSRKMYFGRCPVHGGKNVGACNLYPDGESVPGYWRCNTKRCHDTFKKTILGFVRGVLSNQKFGWAKRGDKQVSWNETVDWCCEFLGQKIHEFKVDYGELEKRRFATEVAQFTRKPEQSMAGLTRDIVRRHLKIPAEYFVKRGWSPEVLDLYDVGLYPGRVDEQGKHHPLCDRVAVPIYDAEYRHVVGFTGRSIHERCSLCGRFHGPTEACPNVDDVVAWSRTSKWTNYKFNKESYLYGYWLAKQAIRDTGVAVIVEGPGDVWQARAADIDMAVGLMGVDLSDEGQIILESSGAMNLIILMDTDKAGVEAKESLKKKLSRTFRLHFPNLSTHDVGETSVEQLKKEIVPLIQNIIEKGY
jgi:5S rRNA maturation endonuclease (ribonuclease M5)